MRNEIEKVLAQASIDADFELNPYKYTDQILSLLEGSLKETTREQTGLSDPIQQTIYLQGWNACLQEIRSKLK